MALGLLCRPTMHRKSKVQKSIAAASWLALSLALGSLPSCYEKPQPETCEAGALGCECKVDGGCKAHLSCIKDQCVPTKTVFDDEANGGEDTSTGGASAGGSAGSDGTAGATSGGSAGESSNAGAAGVGADSSGGRPADGDGDGEGNGDSAGSAGTSNTESTGGTGGTASTATGGKASAGTGNTSSSTGGNASSGTTGGAGTVGSGGMSSGGWGADGPLSGGQGGTVSTGGATSSGGSLSAGGSAGASGLPSSCLGCAVEGCVGARVACQADVTCLNCINTNYRSESCFANAAYQALKSCFCNNFCATVCESACK